MTFPDRAGSSLSRALTLAHTHRAALRSDFTDQLGLTRTATGLVLRELETLSLVRTGTTGRATAGVTGMRFKYEGDFVKSIEVVANEDSLVRLRAKANFKSLGKRYGGRTKEAAAQVAQLSPAQVGELEHGRAVSLGEFEYGAEDVIVEREVRTDWLVASDGPYVAALDPTLTPELEAEGLVRELVSRVQRLRKEAGFGVTDRIALAVRGPEAVLAAARNHQAFITEETLARRFEPGGTLEKPELEQQLDLDGHAVTVGLARLGAGS
jgi:hypothetical protein